MVVPHQLVVEPAPRRRADAQRWVVGDIHGCLRTFRYLVEEGLQLTKDDQLFLLGDYIDRGPDSSGVLDYILTLKAEGYDLFALRGNHEQMLLEAIHDTPANLADFLGHYKAFDLLGDRGQICPRYQHFLMSLPCGLVMEDSVLVHAGLNFGVHNPFQDWEAMLWTTEAAYDPEWLKGRKLVYGHTPLPLNDIRERLRKGETLLGLDNGCVFHPGTHQAYNGQPQQWGNLLALNLDTMMLVVAPNRETD